MSKNDVTLIRSFQVFLNGLGAPVDRIKDKYFQIKP